ncbi:MAG: hypothetical protein F9K32_04475 [Desulfobulbaceae bacterium]|nr:MAG: hypothetical protein F9K32_04475 [Desulfobulbaceae bacterium]
MSREILWQICHKTEVDNREFSEILVKMIRDERISTKQIARDLNIPTERARNWFYRNTGMTALDLMMMMHRYEFIRQAIEYSFSNKTNQTGQVSNAT